MKNIIKINEDIKNYISYNPETGDLFYFKKHSKKASAIRLFEPLRSKDKDGYIKVYFMGHNYGANRVAWFLHYGEQPKGVIDHINRVVDDNRICNLRDVSHRDNSLNKNKQCEEFNGTSFNKASKKWVSYTYVNKKMIFLGSYMCRYQAKMARIMYDCGEFKNTNNAEN